MQSADSHSRTLPTKPCDAVLVDVVARCGSDITPKVLLGIGCHVVDKLIGTKQIDEK